jgi:hypothetical protein
MNDQIGSFLERLDEALIPHARQGEYLDLFPLGRAALVMHYGLGLSTSDFDIVELRVSDLERRAIELLGKDTALARALGLYLDPVRPGVPPLPGWFRKRAEPVSGPWKVIRLWKLEIHDLATTKLKSFRPKDQVDVRSLCDLGLLNAARLRASLEAAFPLRSPKDEDSDGDPDDPHWSRALANFRRVEDYLNGKRSVL